MKTTCCPSFSDYHDNIATTDQPADWQIVDGYLAELLVGIDDEETAE
jgi:hypothetical protein